MQTVNTQTDFQTALDSYLQAVQLASDKKFQEEYPNTWARGQAPRYEAIHGKRYVKIVRVDCQKSVFCFIDIETGDMYKAAGWNAPAKGIRGNIFDEKRPLNSGAFYRYR